MRWRAFLMCGVLIACACGGDDTARTATTEEATTTMDEATTTTDEGTTTTATDEPSTTTAPRFRSVEPFSGSASCSEGAGDVQFPNSGADLTMVEVNADGEVLTVRWHAAGPIEPTDDVQWRVETWAPSGRYLHYFIVSGDGEDFAAITLEQGAPDTETEGTVRVVDGVLEARFPFTAIANTEDPSLVPPFRWAALTNGGQIDGDHCPDRATALAENHERLDFPN